MEWFVYYYNFNAGKIQPYNVLLGKSDKIRKLKRESSNDIAEFANKLRSEMMYYFWGKFEWEITISSYGDLTNGEERIRVDAWDQIAINWERFVDYCWSAADEL